MPTPALRRSWESMRLLLRARGRCVRSSSPNAPEDPQCRESEARDKFVEVQSPAVGVIWLQCRLPAQVSFSTIE
ncbi:hypothetical protein TNCV_2558521 [Trichonephila clavipes]|nr:hypothetical protein TNCV_2558521 [Trichonephila clavipes]